MIGATRRRARTQAAGRQQVLVGIIDTGIDGSHPDIAPNFDAACQPQLHDRHPAHRRAVRGDDAAATTRPTSTTTATARTSRARSARRSTASASLASRPKVDPRQHPRRSGLRLLLPAADRRRADLRGRQRDRRREHELLHRSVALQLPRQPGRLAEEQAEQRTIIEATQRALDYAHDHGVTLIVGRRQRGRRPRRTRARRHQPGLPAGHRARARRSTTLPRPADRGRRRDRRVRRRPEQRKAVLLELRRSSRPTSRRRAATSATSSATGLTRPGQPHPSTYPRRRCTRSARSRPAVRDRHADRRADRELAGDPLARGPARLLALPARHVDGVPARGRCRGTRGGRVGKKDRWYGGLKLESGQGRAHHAPDGHGHRVPGAAPVRLSGAGQR